jgi:nucleoside-diphosphate-sugar epimerase
LEEIRNRYPHARLDYVVGNLASPDDARRAVEGIETIYHLAAGMRGLPATIFVNTVVASKYLLEAIQDNKRRVVLV